MKRLTHRVHAQRSRSIFFCQNCASSSPSTVPTMARNSEVSAHVGHLSRGQLFAKKGLYKRKHAAAPAAAAPAATTVTKTIGGKANGTSRVLPVTPAPAFYPSEDVSLPKKSRKTLRPTKLRSTITPGTILILLAGRFRGKRVVFLKQLAGGLLLVTGPFKINGVPLRRVNQAYVIATSTKVDISSLTVRLHFVQCTSSSGRVTNLMFCYNPFIFPRPRLSHSTNYRLMPKLTTPTSPSPPPPPATEPKPNSSRPMLLRRRLTPSQSPPTKRPLTRRFSPLLPRPPTSTSTSPPLSD